jgi:PAS domain S-box-containing protein
VRYRGGVVVAIPAACLLITLGAWVWSREALLAIRRNVEATQRNIISSNEVLKQSVNAETGVRGYAITQQSSFLEPYRQAQGSLGTELQKLEQKVEADPQRRQSVQEIEQLSQRSMADLQQVIDEARQQPLDARSRQLIPLMEANKRSMDNLRAAIAQLQAIEQQRLEAYLQQRSNVQDATSVALWFTAIISALGSWAAIYLFTQVDQDLSDREQRLKESKSMLHAIVTNVVDGVITLDKFGKIDSFNPTASQLFGYQPGEVLGKDLNLILAEPNPQETTTDLELVVRSRRTWQTLGLRRDSSVFPIAVSVSDVQLDDHRLIVIIRDMTEVQQTQAKLQARADELVQMSSILAQTNLTLEDRNRELEQFAYVASHDLKAPLRAIANLSEWIEEDLQGQLPAENQKQMQLLRGRVHRMEALINGLLEYSRVGRTKAAIEFVNVAEMLDEVIDSLAPPATFTVDLVSPMPTLHTKAMALRQVFANLISNAIKHHHSDTGQIQISVKDVGTAYEFAIADNGPGIHPDYHQKIFTIFQTLQARDIKESTGIGLAIVKKIVESEGGKIWVESQEGKGATFYFTWWKQMGN